VSFKIVNHGGCRGNTAWALSQRRHSVALHEAMDALHPEMRIVLYCLGGMGIKIVVNLPALFVIVNFVVAHNHTSEEPIVDLASFILTIDIF
jgi:hypothetical protein